MGSACQGFELPPGKHVRFHVVLRGEDGELKSLVVLNRPVDMI